MHSCAPAAQIHQLHWETPDNCSFRSGTASQNCCVLTLRPIPGGGLLHMQDKLNNRSHLKSQYIEC